MGSWVDNHYLWLKNNFNIVATYDRDDAKKEKSEEMGFCFFTLDELKQQNYDTILITSTYESEIRKYLVEDLNITKTILSGNQLYDEYEKKFENGKIVHLGEYCPDKTFCIIQRGDTTGVAGLFGLFNVFIREIKYALEHDQIPVVDLKNYKNAYHESWKDVGRVNTWDLFFQPLHPEHCLEDVYKADKVVFSDKRDFCSSHDDIRLHHVIHDRTLRAEYHAIYTDYIRLSERISNQFLRIKNELFHFEKQEKVLGVSIRGTDYTLQKPYLHDIQPSVLQVEEKIRYAVDNWGITKIYVNSEEQKNVDYIKQQFPGMVIHMERELYDSYDNKKDMLLLDMDLSQGNSAYRRGADYLVSILLLAECDCFIGGVNAGSLFTLIAADHLEHEYIFSDLGVYGIDDDAYIYTPDGKPIYVNH
jgi:hypothetical protein